MFLYVFANITPNNLICFHIGHFWQTRTYLYLYLSRKWDPNIFVFAKKCQPKFIYIRICQKMPTQTYSYLYLGLKIVFLTHCIMRRVSYRKGFPVQFLTYPVQPYYKQCKVAKRAELFGKFMRLNMHVEINKDFNHFKFILITN